MSIPQLFYIGILAGLLNHIPGMDLGTLVFATFLNHDFYGDSLKKTITTVSIMCLGYLITLFIPLVRLDPLIYYFSESILSFFFGHVLFSVIYLGYKSDLSIKIGNLAIALVVLISSILIKSFIMNWNLKESLWMNFIQC